MVRSGRDSFGVIMWLIFVSRELYFSALDLFWVLYTILKLSRSVQSMEHIHQEVQQSPRQNFTTATYDKIYTVVLSVLGWFEKCNKINFCQYKFVELYTFLFWRVLTNTVDWVSAQLTLEHLYHSIVDLHSWRIRSIRGRTSHTCTTTATMLSVKTALLLRQSKIVLHTNNMYAWARASSFRLSDRSLILFAVYYFRQWLVHCRMRWSGVWYRSTWNILTQLRVVQ